MTALIDETLQSMAFRVARNPEVLNSMSDEELLRLNYDWNFWGRPNQMEPSLFIERHKQIWLLLAGRGWGKTRVGAETTNKRVREGRAGRIALVAPTAADARDIMIEGPSGIVTISPPWFKAKYISSKRRIEWPNGAYATMYSAEDPDQLRGPQHDFAWCDEIAAWARLVQQEVWDNLMFGLREGASQVIVTTTPRPIPLIKDLLKANTTFATRASTYENFSNLSETFKQQTVSRYEGTRLGRQELHAEVLEDTPGALWTGDLLDENRISPADLPELKRIAVAIDPSGSRDGHEQGILIGGISYTGEGYLLRDSSGHYTPSQWANRALDDYDEYGCDVIIGETNYGGEMVEAVIRGIANERAGNAPLVNFKAVKASRGKTIRAEPVAALDERHIVHLVGHFPELEEQLTTWLAEDGPNDRLDAYVWLWTALMPAKVHGRVWSAS